jgi:hypothetical protein
VTETWQINPMTSDLVHRVQNTQIFLRMAAIELRRIAEWAPDIAIALQDVAQKLEAEAGHLTRCDSDGGASVVSRLEQ